MSRLPLRFRGALNALASPLPVKTWVETGSYVNGAWTKDKGPETFIKAVVLVMKTEELQFYAQGNASQGGIVLHTLAQMFIADVERGGVENRQSFVEWNGYTFRIIGTGFATPNSDHYTYNALQYTDYGIYPQ